MEEEFTPPKNFVVTAALFEGGLAVAAVVLGRVLGYPPLESFHWVWSDFAWGLLGTLPPLFVFYLCVETPFKPLGPTTKVVDELLVPLFKNCRLLELAIISLLAGLGEEMLFRIIVQQSLADWIGGSAGPWIGLLAAAVLFGLLHLLTPVYGLMAALIGLYLGWLWMASGNLLVPITVHATYDFVALVYLVRIRKGTPP
jgi:membrane protease YdiL (CAAX protease family)